MLDNFRKINFSISFDIFDADYDDDNLDNQLYLKAVEVYGDLGLDECFGYVPLLGLGGSEKIENI